MVKLIYSPFSPTTVLNCPSQNENWEKDYFTVLSPIPALNLLIGTKLLGRFAFNSGRKGKY